MRAFSRVTDIKRGPFYVSFDIEEGSWNGYDKLEEGTGLNSLLDPTDSSMKTPKFFDLAPFRTYRIARDASEISIRPFRYLSLDVQRCYSSYFITRVCRAASLRK